MRSKPFLYVLLSIVPIAAVAGFLWVEMSTLPSYVVAANGSAVISQQGLTNIFSADSTYSVLGMAGGLVFGAVCWHNLRKMGWPITLVALFGSLITGLLAWWLGTLLGPRDFDERLAHASVNEVVGVDLGLHVYSAPLAWPFGAMLLLTLTAAFWPHDKESSSGPRRGRKVFLGETVEGETVIDDQGVATAKRSADD